MSDTVYKVVKKAGGQAKVARALEVSPQRVHSWIKTTGKIPGQYVLKMEYLTGVSRDKIRPDIFCMEPGWVHRNTGRLPG
jgi:DNA-binding transcriptional regulator YdaS (Cro superfamily)